MAEQLPSLKQVIDFIVRLDNTAVTNLTNQLTELNKQRQEGAVKAEELVTAATSAEFAKRIEIGRKALQEIEAALKQVDGATPGGGGSKEKSLGSKIFGSASNIANEVSAGIPGNTPGERMLKEMTSGIGQMADALSKGDPVQALVSLGKATLQVLIEAHNDDLRRERDQIQMAGGTAAFARFGGSPDEAVQARMTQLLTETLSSVNDQMRPQVAPTMAAMLRARPEELRAEDTMKVRSAFERLTLAADQVGDSWSDFARTVGDFSRKERITIEAATSQVSAITLIGQKIAQNIGEIDINKFVHATLQIQDQLRPFGYSIQESTALVGKFAVELDRGTLSLGDLVQYATGATRAEKGMLAFLGQQIMQQNTPLSRMLRDQTGGDAVGMAHMMQALAERDPTLMRRLGKVSAKDQEELAEQARMAMEQVKNEFANRMAGSGAPEAQAGRRQMAMEMFEQGMGQGMSGKTLEQQRLLREGAGREGPITRDLQDRAVNLSETQLAEIKLMREDTKTVAARVGDVYHLWLDHLVGAGPSATGRAIAKELSDRGVKDPSLKDMGIGALLHFLEPVISPAQREMLIRHLTPNSLPVQKVDVTVHHPGAVPSQAETQQFFQDAAAKKAKEMHDNMTHAAHEALQKQMYGSQGSGGQ